MGEPFHRVPTCQRTSASVLQSTGFGETWYHGLTVTATRRFSQRWEGLASYTLSTAKDTSTDFQSTFLPQDHGQGRDPADPNGLPLDSILNLSARRRCRTGATTSCSAACTKHPTV